MDEVFHGSTIARFLYLRNGSEEVRERIRTTSRLIRTFPFEEPVCDNFPYRLLSCDSYLTWTLLKAFLPD